MQKVIAVKFIKAKPPYNAGENAGFPENVAADLVRKKIAVLVNENEIEIEPEKTETPINLPEQSLLRAFLEGTKAEIEKILVSKEEDGNFTLSDSDLGKMVAVERNGKSRKGVIKAIEDEIFKRLQDNG